MLEIVSSQAQQVGLDVQTLIIGTVAIGAFLIVVAISSALRTPNVAAVRIAGRTREARLFERQNRGILRPVGDNGKGFLRPFLPADAAERSELERKLAQAGMPHSRALMRFTMVRIMLGLVLPGLLVGAIALSRTEAFIPYAGSLGIVSAMSNLQVFQLLAVLVAAGYFGPSIWLSHRVTERRRRVEEGFPNALDLMQISIEAGLGFDSAMTRVGHELASVSPDIAFEFLSVQTQVQAGRPREVALLDMADRTGVETVRSFANVVHQSMQFGTSMAGALQTYSMELRNFREIRAQEIANKLPVKMSAVLASLMLPALILLTVGPVLIRYIRFFGG